VSTFAAALVRGSSNKWFSAEIDLSTAADIDEVADQLRDVDIDADVSLLFVESDDTYLAILRLDAGEDLRVFGSDRAFIEESRLGAILLGDLDDSGLEIDDVVADADDDPDDDEDGDTDDDTEEPLTAPAPADADPAGDADLLADLGVPARRLLDLCTQEGMLPADITAEICQALGCPDSIEELREV